MPSTATASTNGKHPIEALPRKLLLVALVLVRRTYDWDHFFDGAYCASNVAVMRMLPRDTQNISTAMRSIVGSSNGNLITVDGSDRCAKPVGSAN